MRGTGPRLTLASALLVIGLGACATSPTGRKQLTLIPDGQMDALGAQSFSQLKSQTPVENDPATNRYVKCVAQPVLDASQGMPNTPDDWEIVVFRDDSANAFALPGGKIGVHTGLLKVAKTDAQLAAVLGHEVGHVIAQHGNERVSQALAAQGGLAALDAMTKNSASHGTLMGLLGLGAQVGILLPFSRTQESESDEIGLDLMARAGFDPRDSVELWKNMMAAAGGGGPPEFLSTHPASENRIESLQSKMPGALQLYQQAQSKGHRPQCQR